MDLAPRFHRCFSSLAVIGRDPAGGWTRLAWTSADHAARQWFEGEAATLGLVTKTDRSGNVWAWWGVPGGGDAVVTGSHLDTVPNGGAFDGALGLVCGLLAVEELQHRGAIPQRPVAVVAFADEEGGRFNTPTLGSRVLTGALDPNTVLGRVDRDGIRMDEAITRFGWQPATLGADSELVGRIGAFVELHIEQGRAMADLDTPVAVCSRILPHGRWRLSVSGEANHAGTTRLGDRRDAALVLAHAVLEARRSAAANDALATIGRVEVRPNAVTSVAGRVTAWLDCRAGSQQRLDDTVSAWRATVDDVATAHGCVAVVEQESMSAEVRFDEELTRRIRRRLDSGGWTNAQLATAAGHDAGVLAAHAPSAMLFVRNPSGVSHSPHEHAVVDDCLEGVRALSAVLEDLAC